ncbi:hypothetical protein ACQ4PT_040647 [Festuca glaucescens]
MVEPRDELIQHLVGEDEGTAAGLQLKTTFIHGPVGMGKTTLANLVYEAIGDKFQSRAFVSLTRGGNMSEVLARILQEVSPSSSVPLAGTEAVTEEELLMDIISNFLKDRRSLRDHRLKEICDLVRLRHLLGLKGDRVTELPPEIVRLRCLDTFIRKLFAQLPGFIGKLQQLKTLDVRGMAIDVEELQTRRTLTKSSTCIKELPKETGALQQLQTLRMRYTDINELPKENGSLQQLETLDMSYTPITVLPKEIGKLQKLKTLDIFWTPMTALPREIGSLQQLEC